MRKAIWKWAALCLSAAALGGCGSDGGANHEDARKTGMSLDGAAEGSQSGGTGSAQAQNGQGQGSFLSRGSENRGSFTSRGNADQDGGGSGEKPADQESQGQEDAGPLTGDGQRETGQKNAGSQEAGQKNVGSQEAGQKNKGSGEAGQKNTGSEDAGNAQESAGTRGGRLTDLDTAADVNRKEMLDTYITILEDVYFDQVFPGDEEYGYQPGAGIDVTSNSFAVYDIDFDGEDELILSYTTTYMGGMVALIYGYDAETKSVRKELGVFPSLTFYDNGIVQEEASHNHGMASDGAFWPYSLYQYDREKDAYVRMAGVDAWSRFWREEDYDGNPFPEEADADGDGLVYYVMPGDDYVLAHPMDQAAYDEWRDSLLKGAAQVQIPYKKLTTDNIYTIK